MIDLKKMNECVWILSHLREEARVFSAELGIQPEIAQILMNRGVCSPEAAQNFLYGTLDGLHDPYLMRGMKEAVERIIQAVRRKEKILIFGDYDVDGVLSVVILLKALSSLGGEVDYYIPERLKDGYGIKEEYIDIVVEKKAGLVISVDCGIKATEFSKKAKENGVDIIITDHHLPGDCLPESLAILNPVIQGSGYPDKDLAGIGVVFKLIQALFKRSGKPSDLRHYLKMVAIGTIADVSELKGENRLFVKFGLKALETVSNTGLLSLMELCGLEGKRVTVGDVGFRIGPRINAAGRMGAADLAVRLFFADSLPESLELARHLDELNSERQRTQERIHEQALRKIRERSLNKRYKFLILGCEEWHRGVIGIVASKLKDFFHRPVLLFAYKDAQAFGSGRSISEFPLIECLDSCKDLLLDYGGHTVAVGCTLVRENVAFFKKAVNAFAGLRITEEQMKRKIYVDSTVDFTDIDSSFIENYSLLSPFGVGNPKPIFLTEKAEVIDKPRKIKDKHCKLWLRQNGRIFEALGWERGDWALSLQKGDEIDLVYSFQFSKYLGEEKLNLSLEDIRKKI
jgi:single-stranded-DNA-specific exonuclease